MDDDPSCRTIKLEPASGDAAVAMDPFSVSAGLVEIKKECLEHDVKVEDEISDLTCCVVASGNMCLGIREEPSVTQIDYSCGLPVDCTADGSVQIKEELIECDDEDEEDTLIDVASGNCPAVEEESGRNASQTDCPSGFANWMASGSEIELHMKDEWTEDNINQENGASDVIACDVTFECLDGMQEACSEVRNSGHACTDSCQTKSDQIDHVIGDTEKKPYACKFCGYRSNHASDVTRHERTHTREKPYVCEVCNARFSEASILKRHTRTHTGEKPYVCEVCNFRCRNVGSLTRHKRIHTGEKPHVCEFCNYRFSEGCHLKVHMRTHTGEKPYACEVCNYRCSQGHTLKNHMRTHTGEKPYACDICNFRCNDHGNLTKHKRTHSQENPHVCEVCDYTCRRASTLKNHMRTHTGEKPYACELCNYRCRRATHLKTHMKTHTV